MMVEIGSTLGDYRIEGVIGQGGMGVVYRATQLRLGRPVALKVITPALASDQGFRERFDRESRVTASIDHPNVVPVHEANEVDGLLYIVMRYVEGKDLRTVIADSGRLEPERAARLTAQVGSALDAAHVRGMVHRDVKPGNVLVSGRPPEEHVYLTDFGLTKQISSTDSLTKTGEWVGTLDYVAPEQIEGRAVDARTDVYALGCVLHQALTGEVPFARNSDVAKMFAHMNDPAPPVTDSAPTVPQALDAVVRRAMAKDPNERYPSTGDFGRAAIAAAAGGSLAIPERSVAVGEAAPADATRASAGPGETVPSPAPVAGAAAAGGAAAAAGAAAGQTAPSPGPEQAETVPLPHSAGGTPPPVAPAAAAGAQPARRSNRGLVIAGVAALVLALAGGATAAVVGGVFDGGGGDGDGSDDPPIVEPASGDSGSDSPGEQPDTKTNLDGAGDPGAAPGPSSASAPCRNSFIPQDQRDQLSDAIGNAEPAVEGSVFYGECEGSTWALASFPDGTDGVFQRAGDGWTFLGPIDVERCDVPAELLTAWMQPTC